MALEAALFYVDAQSIKGDNSVEIRADSSEVIEVHHDVYKPIDAQSGRPAGARVHGPLKVLKRLDKATPLLYKALCDNQNLPVLELRWYRPDPTGSGEIQHFQTTKLENGLVAKIEAWLPNTMASDEAHYSPMEWVHINYQKITWTYVDGGIEHTDAWTTRNV